MIICATFTDGARFRFGAWYIALIADAHVTAGALIGRDTRSRNANASLFRCGITLKSSWTLARRTMLFQFTQRIWSAGIFQLAEILAVAVVAGFIVRTILVAATSNDTRARATRMIWCALAVTGALYRAFVVDTVFAVGTVVDIATSNGTLALIANAATAFNVTGACR